MSTVDQAYLAIVVCAFLLFIGTLFWGMVTTSHLSDSAASDHAHDRGADRRHHH